jgi:hypothetical protein
MNDQFMKGFSLAVQTDWEAIVDPAKKASSLLKFASTYDGNDDLNFSWIDQFTTRELIKTLKQMIDDNLIEKSKVDTTSNFETLVEKIGHIASRAVFSRINGVSIESVAQDIDKAFKKCNIEKSSLAVAEQKKLKETFLNHLLDTKDKTSKGAGLNEPLTRTNLTAMKVFHADLTKRITSFNYLFDLVKALTILCKRENNENEVKALKGGAFFFDEITVGLGAATYKVSTKDQDLLATCLVSKKAYTNTDSAVEKITKKRGKSFGKGDSVADKDSTREAQSVVINKDLCDGCGSNRHFASKCKMRDSMFYNTSNDPWLKSSAHDKFVEAVRRDEGCKKRDKFPSYIWDVHFGRPDGFKKEGGDTQPDRKRKDHSESKSASSSAGKAKDSSSNKGSAFKKPRQNKPGKSYPTSNVASKDNDQSKTSSREDTLIDDLYLINSITQELNVSNSVLTTTPIVLTYNNYFKASSSLIDTGAVVGNYMDAKIAHELKTHGVKLLPCDTKVCGAFSQCQT